jgi:hypothetical protein
MNAEQLRAVQAPLKENTDTIQGGTHEPEIEVAVSMSGRQIEQ